MGNLNKELGSLFKRYITRKETEARQPIVFRTSDYYKNLWGNNDKKPYLGTIFFYEWSDISRLPTRYFSLSLFEKFLSECDLCLEPHQRDIILNLPQSFISCKKGCKELIVRGSYDSLKSAMLREGTTLILPTVPVPCPASRIALPPMYHHEGSEQWYQ